MYEILTGREREEIVMMAMLVALYYIPYFLQAKETAK